MEISDLENQVYAAELHEGIKVASIGWLGKSVPTTGGVSKEILEILKHMNAFHYVDDGDLGMHSCELCDSKELFHGEIWLTVGDVRYVFPRAIIHYIEAHNYKPPEVFLRDLEEYWNSGKGDDCRSGACAAINKDKSGRERLRELMPPKIETPKKAWWKLWG